jgi:hypothetical protein
VLRYGCHLTFCPGWSGVHLKCKHSRRHHDHAIAGECLKVHNVGYQADNQVTISAHNVCRRNEPIAANTIFADTLAIDGGETMAQFYCRMISLVIDIYGMDSSKEFINTLLDNIQERGAMDKLISNSATVEMSNCVNNKYSSPGTIILHL